MDQFTLFKTSKENIESIISVFKMLLGNHIQMESYGMCFALFHHSSEEKEIKNTILSLESDLNTTISFYQSCKKQEHLLKQELSLVLPLFKHISFGGYDFKSLLLQTSFVENSKEILNYILEDTGVTEQMICAMAELDLNVSKAASLLYLHRNTLIYKIDRLKEMMNFDLKCFKDCFILYRLILKI